MAIYFQIKRKLILSWPFLVHAILQDEKKDLRMKFHFLYFQKWHCLNKGFWKYQNSIHVAFMTKNIERTVINVCFKMNLYFTNWQFYATLWSPKVSRPLYVHCICDVQNARQQTFCRELLSTENNYPKKTLNEATLV